MHHLKNLPTLLQSRKLLILFLAGLLTFLLIGFLFFKPLTGKIFKALRRDVPVTEENIYANSLPGSHYKISVPPEPIDTYLAVDYRMWIPADTATLKGVFVVQHGCSDSGIPYARDPEWQALAAKHDLALLIPDFLTGDKPCEYWALINYGSGKAFFKALQQFAALSGHPELQEVPWVLAGHSGGADWAAQMFQQYSERTIAMVGARCGGFLFFGVNPTILNVPVLFSLGADDPHSDECVELPKTVFHKYRSAGALWTLAVEAETGHEIGRSQSFILSYLDAILPMRLPVNDFSLRPVDQENSWLGNLTTYEIAPASNYQGNPQEATWLPNETIALQWQKHVSGAAVSPE
jgi:hypothetical protein